MKYIANILFTEKTKQIDLAYTSYVNRYTLPTNIILLLGIIISLNIILIG